MWCTALVQALQDPTLFGSTLISVSVRVNSAEGWHFWTKVEVAVSDFYEIWYTYWALWETEKSKIVYLYMTYGYWGRPDA